MRFNYIELKYEDLTNQTIKWLKSEYKKSNINFNSASPYGQILNVHKEFFQHNMLYLKNSIRVLDINTTQNKKLIQQTARISGHNVGRAISATGTLKFTLKPGIDINEEIQDSIIIIEDKTVIKNTLNGLKYSIKLNSDENIFPLTSTNNSFFVPIIQGKYDSQFFTGKGTAMQSFSVNVPGYQQIENFNVEIRLNGLLCEQKERLYDMLPGEFACVVKSGFNGGIDIYFGTGDYGIIPFDGSIIEVKYLISDGVDGEILTSTTDWLFEGDVMDGGDNIIDVKKLFNIDIESPINFASNGETLEFTKSTIPYVSRNFVLGAPKQFIYHLRKLNMFSKVNAYNKLYNNDFSVNEKIIEDQIQKLAKKINQNSSRELLIAEINNLDELYNRFKTNLDDNTIYLYLIPSIEKYFNNTINYFNIPFDVFYLTDDEENKIKQYLRGIGTLSMTQTIKIIQPTISRYIMHVYIRRYEDANEDNIRQEIIAKTSDYLLKNQRFDRIPKSDFVKLYKEIDGVDSASVFFVSKKNEDYHRNIDQLNYDENLMLGIDKVHGDIICDVDEYVVIRGGWRNREGVWYNEDPNSEGLNPININITGITKK